MYPYCTTPPLPSSILLPSPQPIDQSDVATSRYGLNYLVWNQHQGFTQERLGWSGQHEHVSDNSSNSTLVSNNCRYLQYSARPRQSSNSSSTTSSSSWSSLPPSPSNSQNQKRFHAILKAPTANTQKSTSHPSSLTYLNQGQAYAIQLADPQGHDGLIRTELILSFHELAHRRQAMTFWKSWIGQQPQPHRARLVDIDACQSMGITNIHCQNFDRIAFEWHGRQGATVYVRFHCLSTDFSKIKGVKGIPLRVCLSHQTLDRETMQNTTDPIDRSYCRIKLFRDKGAERKYKDDAKQLAKQMEKLNHVGDPRDHPLWLMYNPSSFPTMFLETRTYDVPDEIMMMAAPANGLTQVPSSSTQSAQKELPRSFSYHAHDYHPYSAKAPSTTTIVPTQLYYDASPLQTIL